MPSILARVPRPHSRRGWLFTGLALGAGTCAVGFGVLYLILFGGSSPAPLTLSQAGTTKPSATLSANQVSGTWTAGNGSVAGYRVRERLAFLSGPHDAVGRTSAITGSVTLAGTSSDLTVTAAGFSVDVSTLKSDENRRDNRIHSIGLESDRYPTATFKLTTPISVPAMATNGQAFQVSSKGELTIHGTTKTVTIPLQARLGGGQIEIVGSITFPFSDFGMTPPSIGGFVSVEDNATMEFDLHLQRQS
jgi:polyisoprenoid-binding protein YceI